MHCIILTLFAATGMFCCVRQICVPHLAPKGSSSFFFFFLIYLFYIGIISQDSWSLFSSVVASLCFFAHIPPHPYPPSPLFFILELRVLIALCTPETLHIF